MKKKKVIKIINKLKSDKNYYLKLKLNIVNTQKKILDKNKNIKKIEKAFLKCSKKKLYFKTIHLFFKKIKKEI